MASKNFKTSPFHLPYNPKLLPRAKELRKNPTAAEKKLWYGYLRALGVRVLRQRPIDNFIVDFYCAAAKLDHELSGDSHSRDEAAAYDAQRTRVLEGYGLTVVRFGNREVLNGFEGVCERIGARIFNPPNPFNSPNPPW